LDVVPGDPIDGPAQHRATSSVPLLLTMT
jgi:hypothetical protein